MNNKLSSFGIPNVAKSNAALAASASASAGVPPAPPSGATQSVPKSPEAPTAPFTDQTGSPLTDAYGIKPAQIAQRSAPQGQSSQLDPSLFGPTNDILAQSLEVQKQMLDVLNKIFGVTSSGNGATPAAAAPAASRSDYKVPQAPVPMKRVTA